MGKDSILKNIFERQSKPKTDSTVQAQTVTNRPPSQEATGLVNPRVQSRAEQSGLRVRQPSQLKALLTAENLKSLRKHQDRGEIDLKFVKVGKGLGKFEDVVEAAEKFANANGDDKTEALKLINVLEQYQTPEREEAFQKELQKGEKGDQVTIRKHKATQTMRREARRLLQDPIDERFLASDLNQPRDREQAHQERAKQLIATFGQEKAASGSSDVRLAKDADGKVAYAFKSIDGETKDTGMDPGCGAVREAMASAMSNAIREQTKGLLNLGFPQASVVKLDDKTGALIEGMDGLSYDPGWVEGKVLSQLGPEPELRNKKGYDSDIEWVAAKTALYDYQQEAKDLRDKLEPENVGRKTKASAMAQKLPGKEIQKVLLCNYAMAQFDIKWDNLMMVEDESGKVSARPFDAGAGFIQDEEADRTLVTDVGGPGYMLLADPVDESKLLDGAKEPIDKDMREQFLSIKLDVLKQTMEMERARLAKDHGMGKNVLPDKSMLRSYKSIQILQELLNDPTVLTTEDLVKSFCNRLPELKDPS